MEKDERCCGNCHYADYYKRRGGVTITAWVDCEVYTRKMERQHKPCHNWKERKHEG